MPAANRLIREKSPYLLQHAHNPVDWYPWGPEAFARSREQDKPVFLSIGYSTCRWCHIMEREVFEDPECARLLNQHMVSIKVDREERPDLDQLYMTAVQLLAGSGGWPLPAFLLPDGRPFYGGTYFPPGQFKRMVAQLADSYRHERPEVEKAAEETAAAVRRALAVPAGECAPDRSLVSQVLAHLEERFDAAHGGFGGAPKFPPHGALALLSFACQRERQRLLPLITATLDGMALGGFHDHIGGGFHRYATDAAWFLPHFEKMLYDNALLARAYVEGYLLTGDVFYRRVAEGVYAWVAREMTGPEGAFFCGLDAESEGEEGKSYLWRRDEIMDLLGQEDGELFCRAYGVSAEGNYQEERGGLGRSGANIIHLKQRLSPELEVRLGPARARLLAARQRRTPPHRDDKVLTAWNGLMIGSLAFAGRCLAEPAYTRAAQEAAGFLLTHSQRAGRLRRRWREGEVGEEVFLDDYAFLAQGLLELHETTGESGWLERSRELMEVALRDFADQESGGFYFTPRDAEALFARPKEVLDQPLPSSNAAAIQALVRLARLTGAESHRRAADRALRALCPWIARTPHGTESLALAAAMHLE